MSEIKEYRRKLVIEPKASTQFNQFLPSKEKQSGYCPAPMRRTRPNRNDDNRRSWASPQFTDEDGSFSSELGTQRSMSATHIPWPSWYESSDSDADHPDPDVVLDDLASRRFHSPSVIAPTNFALPMTSGKSTGMTQMTRPKGMIANVPQATLTYLSDESQLPQRAAQRPESSDIHMYDDSEEDDNEIGNADPVQDDFYARKLGMTGQPSASVHFDTFLPKFWTPEEDRHVKKIRLGSQRRPWYREMQGFSQRKSGSFSVDSESDVVPRLHAFSRSQSEPPPSHPHTSETSTQSRLSSTHRLMQRKPGSHGSASLSEMPIEAVTSKINYEELQKMRGRMRENEDKWQDDLTKWKNRRKSVNSDIVKKKEEREQIEVLTGGIDTKRSKTFKEMEEERENREPGYRSRFSMYSTSEDVFEEPMPKTRTMNRSYTIDTPYSSRNRSLPSLIDDQDAGILASDNDDFPTSPIQSNTGNKLNTNQNQTSTSNSYSILDDPVPTSVTNKTFQSLPEPTRTTQLSSTSSVLSRSSLETNINSKPDIKSSSFVGTAPETRNSYSRVEDDQIQTTLYKPDPSEKKQPVVSRVSASLPRSYQKIDSTRITSFVAPRPFGTQSTRVTSLPRSYTVDDKEQNGERVSTKTSYVSSMKESVLSTNGKQEVNQAGSSAGISSSITPVGRVSPQPKTQSYSDMRVSLNQKPNSSRDFGFQNNWDSTGTHVKYIQPGSPAELGQLQVGDEIMAINGQKVTDMSYNEWKKCMDEALQQGSLLMDIRRHGKRNWDRDLPSLPFKSHKTINLTSPGPLGSPEPYVSSLDFTSRSATDPTVKTLNVSASPVNSLTSLGINGGIREEKVTLRNKESEPISMKNFKRRSEFFEQGGSESASDLPVQSPAAPSTRSTWDPEEERKRQEKWQKEQERQLQEKYRRDQEKMEEEFRKAQQEADIKRRELQQEEERRKREEERKRMEQEEERRRQEQQKRLDERRYQESYQRLQENEVGSDYTNTFPELSYSHRMKSKSTPELDDLDRTDIKGVYSRHRGLASWLLEEELRRKNNPQILKQQAASELELERRNILSAMRYRNPEKAGLGETKKESVTPADVDRQQIIQDMKKKTSLLTDNSWIRQSASTNNKSKEPVNVSMRRGESLDNLDTKPSSWRSSWTPTSTSTSITDYSRPPRSSLSGSSYNSGNSVTKTLPASQHVRSNNSSSSPSPSSSTTGSMPDQSTSKNRSVSGKKICTNCDMPLGKGAAMIIESLGLCFHLHCFKCIQCKCDLGGSENGAEVRIRNKQLFCHTCYMRVKNGQPTAM